MSESFDDLLPAGSSAPLPRFLSNIEPLGANSDSADEFAAAWTSSRVTATGVAGAVALMSSAFLAPDGVMQRASLAAIPVVETVRVTPMPVVQSEGVEERLAFAERFGAHLQAMSRLQDLESVAVTPLAPQPPIGEAPPLALPAREPESASLLIVRNLPEGATFSDGVAAGIGAWAIGGQDPQVVVAAIEGGIDEAMTAQVDLIAPSGATLETRAVDLPAKPKVASVSKAAPWQAANGRMAKAEPGKLGPKRRAAAFKRKGSVKTAEQATQKPKRRKRRADDAYRAQAQKAEVAETGSAGVQGEPAEQEGALAKFFSLFKGSGGDSNSEAAAAKESSRDYDGSLRGLGMSPQD